MERGEVGIEELIAAVARAGAVAASEPVATASVRLVSEGVFGRVTANVTHHDDDDNESEDGTGRTRPAPAPLCSTVPIHGLPPSFSPFACDEVVRNTLLER
jgi:hypothetical protein